MQVFQNIVYTISRYAAYASAAILCYMVGHILLEIVLRTFFSTSTFMLDEMIGHGVAALPFFLLMGWRRGSSPCFRKSPCGCRTYCLIR